MDERETINLNPRSGCAPFIAHFAMSGALGSATASITQRGKIATWTEIHLSHSKRKERVLNGAQSIAGEPKMKVFDRATCLKE